MKRYGSLLLTAFVLAVTAAVMLAGAALAADRHAGSTPTAAGQSATSTAADRDVPGAAVDPSKKDHDNGVGNNCDPGWGKGNQADFPNQSGDSTGCRTAATTGGVSGQSAAAAARSGNAPASTTSVPSRGGVSAANANAGVGAANANGGVLAASASSGLGGAVGAAHGAVLAATGLPVGAAFLGILIALAGTILLRVRRFA